MPAVATTASVPHDNAHHSHHLPPRRPRMVVTPFLCVCVGQIPSKQRSDCESASLRRNQYKSTLAESSLCALAESSLLQRAPASLRSLQGQQTTTPRRTQHRIELRVTDQIVSCPFSPPLLVPREDGVNIIDQSEV